MALKAPAAFSPCIVEWEDAEAAGSEQYESPEGALASFKPAIRKSIGYWVGYALKNGRECAILATDDDRRADSPQAIGGCFQIPRGLVISIEALRLGPPKRRRR